MYQVLARKWRPQSLDELVGQAHVARTLRNALSGNRLAHAYLFAGLRGTGKTTVARILAKCLNCEQGPTATPCNRCSSCTEIGEGRSLDVLEIDAASRTGVGDIRELQEVVSYAPVRDRYRVLVIDEVHMLSKNAFNALLKTLEEPPASVVFVLATTEIQKVIPTILSRCQVFDFRRVPAREVAAHLRKICDAEKIEISKETLDRIARAGEGSVRDSLSVLERVLAFCGTKVSDDEALQVLGAVKAEVLAGMIRGVAARDAGAMLTTLDAVADEGHDLLHFWQELVAAVRDVQILRALPDRADLLARPVEEVARLDAAAEGLSTEDLARAFQVLAGIEHGLKSSAQPRFLFEAALIRLASLGAVVPIEQILASLGSGVTATAPSPARIEPQKKKDDDAVGPAIAEREAPGDAAAAFLVAVREARPMLGHAVASASIAVDADVVTLSFDAAAEASRRMVEREETLGALRKCAEDALGRRVQVRVAGAKPAAIPAPAVPRREVESAVPSDPPRVAPGPAIDYRELLEKAKHEPGVERLLREFGAQVIDIRPLDAAPSVEPEAAETGPTEEPR
jgi:DNA polymerase-3 subunit gamma/tau